MNSTQSKVMTETEMAKQAFLDSISQLRGVSVCLHGGQTLGEQSIRIIVPDLLGDAASQIRQAEIQVRRNYRNVRLNLAIEESEDSDKPMSVSSGKCE